MTVEYHYWRYLCPYMDVEPTLQKALARAKYEVENEEAHPEKIVCEDGTILLHEEIMERSGYYNTVDIDGEIVDGSLTQPVSDPTKLLE